MSSVNATSPLRLQTQGALREGALYVERAADRELLAALRNGDFCYVLAPRQIGKSSLRFHIARQLATPQVHCAHVDLTEIGRSADQEAIAAWYFSIADRLAAQLELEDPKPFFEQQVALLPAQRFLRYLTDKLLTELVGQVIIFIDEIDYLRTLESIDTDEFFAAIRSIYNARPDDRAYERLTFCLLGVASPDDLIKNPEITPFNIGVRVRLEDFSRQELSEFEPVLARLAGELPTWLDEVFAWTGGHPYMTQLLLQHLSGQPVGPGGSIAEHVQKCVEHRFLHHGRSEDPNLSYAEKRLDRSPHKGDLLALYRRILTEEELPPGGSPFQAELCLCGFAAERMDDAGVRQLRPRNRIFTTVFDDKWLREKETRREWTEALRRWQASTQSPNALLRDTVLVAAQAWAAEHPLEVTSEESEFLLASVEHARRAAEEQRLVTQLQLERAQRQQAEDRSRNQRRTIMLLLVIILGLVVAFLLITERIRAVKQAQKGEQDQRIRADIARKGAELALVEAEKQRGRAVRAEQLAVEQAAFADKQARMAREGEHMAQEATKKAVAAQLAEQVAHAKETRATSQLLDMKAKEAGQLRAELAKQERERKERSERQQLATNSRSNALASFRKGQFDEALLNALQLVDIIHPEPGSPLGPSQQDRLLLTVFNATWQADKMWENSKIVLQPTTSVFSQRMAKFSPDGALVMVLSDDGKVRFFNASDGEKLQAIEEASLKAPLIAEFTKDSHSIVLGDAKGILYHYNIQTDLWNHEDTGNGSITSLKLDRKNQTAIAGTADGHIVLWNLSHYTMQRLLVHTDQVNALDLSANGCVLASGSRDHQVNIIDLCNRERPTDAPRSFVLRGHTGSVLNVGFSPAMDNVASASSDGTVRIWPLVHAAGKLAATPPLVLRNDGPVTRIRFLPSGRKLLTAGKDGVARLFALPSGECLARLDGHVKGINDLDINPAGDIAATASDDGTGRLWQLPETIPKPVTGGVRIESVLTLPGHSGFVRSIRFSPDGKWVITSSLHGSGKIFPASRSGIIETACRYLRLKRHVAPETSLCSR